MKGKIESRKRIKRIGTSIIVGMFLVIMLSPIVVADADTDVPALGSYSINIDSNNDEVDRIFRVTHNADPGTELFRVQEDGRVGIADTTPDFQFEVAVSSGYGVFAVSSAAGNDGDLFKVDNYGNAIFNDGGENNDFRIEGDTATHLFFVDANWDNIGINDASPDFRLEMAGSVGSGYLGISSTVTGDGDIFIIDSSGRVGIGVASPAEKLEINGNMMFSTGADRDLYVETPSADSDGYDLAVRAGNGYTAGVGPRVGGDLHLKGGDGAGTSESSIGGNVYIYAGLNSGHGPDTNVILAHTGSAARGKVGIGTTTPDSTLDILSTSGTQLRLTHTDSTHFAAFGVSINGLLNVYTVDGGGSSGHISFNPDGNVGIGTTSPDDTFEIEWDTNVDVEIGRGTTDTDITFITLRSEDGIKCYIYPNSTEDGIEVTTTHP